MDSIPRWEVSTGSGTADIIPRWEVSAGPSAQSPAWIQAGKKGRKKHTRTEDHGTPASIAPQGQLSLLDQEEEALNNVQAEVPFEVVLDSGAADHVTDNVDAPGYELVPSPGSRAGRSFIAANGEKIANRGQMTLSLKTESGQEIDSTFQVCKTNRPLWSVGKICDAGCRVVFSANKAEVIKETTGKAVCSFQREGGLYVGKLSLCSPGQSSTFQRPGR